MESGRSQARSKAEADKVKENLKTKTGLEGKRRDRGEEMMVEEERLCLIRQWSVSV